MRRLLFLPFALLLLAPSATYGDLTLAAATAKRIPSASAGATCTLFLTNKNAADVFCASSSSVTDSHWGFYVPANGGVFWKDDLVYMSDAGGVVIYCYSALGTSSGEFHYQWVCK